MLTAEAAVRAGRPGMAYGCWSNAASAAACAGDFVRSLDFAERGQAVVHPVLPTCEVHLLATRARILGQDGAHRRGPIGRIQGLIAAARRNRALAERRLREAADRWCHSTQQGPVGDDYVANLADPGRPPVEGLIEPARELETVLSELESVRTT